MKQIKIIKGTDSDLVEKKVNEFLRHFEDRIENITSHFQYSETNNFAIYVFIIEYLS